MAQSLQTFGFVCRPIGHKGADEAKPLERFFVMAKRRKLTKKERFLLFDAANGLCCKCGAHLGDDWHADHIEPFCQTGRTNVFEMRALCKSCNLIKGARNETY